MILGSIVAYLAPVPSLKYIPTLASGQFSRFGYSLMTKLIITTMVIYGFIGFYISVVASVMRLDSEAKPFTLKECFGQSFKKLKSVVAIQAWLLLMYAAFVGGIGLMYFLIEGRWGPDGYFGNITSYVFAAVSIWSISLVSYGEATGIDAVAKSVSFLFSNKILSGIFYIALTAVLLALVVSTIYIGRLLSFTLIGPIILNLLVIGIIWDYIISTHVFLYLKGRAK